MSEQEVQNSAIVAHDDVRTPAISASKWLTFADKAEWMATLERFPAAQRDVYFLPEYVHLHETEHDHATCFTYTEGENAFLHCFVASDITGTPYRDVTTAYGYGGPIANTDDRAFAHRAYDAFLRDARMHGVVAERIRFHPLLGNHELLVGVPGVQVIPICPIVYVNIDEDEEQRWANIYTHANRKNINKARREGITVSFGRDDALWAAYHDLYAETMEANNATSFYYFPEAYYRRLREGLRDNYVLAAAHLNDRVVSVLLLLLGPTTAHCHRIGTDRSTMSLGTNNLLHHEVIQWCKRNGLTTLFIGGGRGNTDEDSLFRFKRNFSNETATFYVGESVPEPEVYARLCAETAARGTDEAQPQHLFRYRR